MFGFLKRRKVDPQKELNKLFGAYELPSFPGTILETLGELRKPESTATSVADVLSADPGLSVRLLKVVNSSAYGLSRRVEHVGQAVALFGHSGVESLVLSIGVKEALPSSPAPGFESKRFWRTAARRAAIAQVFAARLHPRTRMLSFTAALLEDMAIPLLAVHKPGPYGQMLDAWHNDRADLHQLEQGEFGWCHGEVATWLCAVWALPEDLASAIGTHHHVDVDQEECPPAVALVSKLRETEHDDGVDELVATAHSKYGLAEDEAVELVREGRERAEDLAMLLA